MIKITREQTDGFLRALHPIGAQGALSSHARTYLEAIIGHVPRGLCGPYFREDLINQNEALANVLKQMAEHMNDAVRESRP